MEEVGEGKRGFFLRCSQAGGEKGLKCGWISPRAGQSVHPHSYGAGEMTKSNSARVLIKKSINPVH